jgi:hypothetical protein
MEEADLMEDGDTSVRRRAAQQNGPETADDTVLLTS